MVTRKALENLYAVYFKATEMFRDAGLEGVASALHEDFGHELSAWDAWYDDGQDEGERPEYAPTMAELNRQLAKYGYKGIGGKNPRVVKL